MPKLARKCPVPMSTTHYCTTHYVCVHTLVSDLVPCEGVCVGEDDGGGGGGGT